MEKLCYYNNNIKKRGKYKMAYNAQNAKPAYYKQQVTTFAQLQKNCMRLVADSRQGYCTKAQNIAKMFDSYKANCNIK